jgi:hypothetical protein
MTTTIAVNKPYVHGSLSITRMDESRVRVQSFSLIVNTIPVLVEGVLMRGRFDEWSTQSFHLQRVQRAANGGRGSSLSRGIPIGMGCWCTSRRNVARAREAILDVVTLLMGGQPQEIQSPRATVTSDGDLLAELLASQASVSAQ